MKFPQLIKDHRLTDPCLRQNWIGGSLCSRDKEGFLQTKLKCKLTKAASDLLSIIETSTTPIMTMIFWGNNNGVCRKQWEESCVCKNSSKTATTYTDWQSIEKKYSHWKLKKIRGASKGAFERQRWGKTKQFFFLLLSITVVAVFALR